MKYIIPIIIVAIAVLTFSALAKEFNIKNITGSVTNTVEEDKIVTKIIDGDTIIVNNGETIRFLGIDTDEKGQKCYDIAKQRLTELIFNKNVTLEIDGDKQDKYGRDLRYVILGDKNINVEILKEGIAVARFPAETGKYRDEIIQAEEYAKNNNIGCKWKEEKQEPTISACETQNYIGQEKTIQGKVENIYIGKKSTMINFEKDYPKQCLTGVIFPTDYHNFPKDIRSAYEQRTIIVKAKIKDYKGKPEIIIKYGSAIKVLD